MQCDIPVLRARQIQDERVLALVDLAGEHDRELGLPKRRHGPMRRVRGPVLAHF